MPWKALASASRRSPAHRLAPGRGSDPGALKFDGSLKVSDQAVSKKAFYPAVRCLSERNFGGQPGDRPGVTNSHWPVFIFLCGQENEPKEAARAPGPFGLPCASGSRRALWNSLTLKQPQGLFRRLLRCSARGDGTSNPGGIRRWKYGCRLRKTPYRWGLGVEGR